jgi:ribosomal protein L11 methyltransferase
VGGFGGARQRRERGQIGRATGVDGDIRRQRRERPRDALATGVDALPGGAADRVAAELLRIAFTLPTDAAEEAIDALVPLLPRGVHQRELAGGRTEVSFYEHAGELPPREQLEAAAGTTEWSEETVPDDPRERRRRQARAWEIAGRLRVRSPADPPGDGSLPELVIEPAGGAFGTGAHPTTRMCLELLLSLEPGGAFADLGCGAGTLAIAAAKLGWAPVLAVDHEPQSIAATRRNAALNGVGVDALELDLTAVPPPPAPTLAANVPPPVHDRVAAGLADAVVRVIASGFVESELAAVVARYEAAGLALRARRGGGWQAVLLERAA